MRTVACLVGGLLLSAVQAQAPRRPAQAAPAAPQPNEGAPRIQFRGTVEARHSLRLTLLPGERAVSTFVELGAEVKTGQPLVRLVHDSLAAGLGSLIDQRIKVIDHRGQTLQLEEQLRQTTAALERAKALVDSQKQAPVELPDYRERWTRATSSRIAWRS